MLSAMLAIEGTDPFLAACNSKQVLVDKSSPAPCEIGSGESGIESLAMNFLGFGQRAIDIKDQGPRPNDPFVDAIEARAG